MAKAKTSKAGATAAKTKKKPQAVTARSRKAVPIDQQQTAPPPQPEPTEAGAASDKGAAAVPEPKSRREASLPKGAVLIAKAGTTSALEPPVKPDDQSADTVPTLAPPTDQAPEPAEQCYIRMPVRVLIKDARRWAAYHQKRLGTVIELMHPSGKGVLARYDNTDREDRIAEYTPLGFAWHPNWLAPAPKPCNSRAQPPTEPKPKVQRQPPVRNDPNSPKAKTLALAMTPDGASPAALKEQAGPHCAGMTYLRRLEKTTKLTLEILPNGNIKFTPREGAKG